MSLQDRIKEIIAAGFSQADLARASKKSSAAVTHWVKGQTSEIKSDAAAGIQEKTGFSAVWIATGKGPKRIDESVDGKPLSALEPSPFYTSRYSDTNLARAPVIEWARLGVDLLKETDELGDGPTQEYVPLGSPGRRVKLVPVTDDCLSPRLAPGDFVAIDPDNRRPERGQVTLFRATSDGTFFLRRFQPLVHPAFEAIDSRGNALDSVRHGLEIVGVRCGVRLTDL